MLSLILCIAGFVVGGIVFFFVGTTYRKKVAEKEIGSAEEEARRIINEAIKGGDSEYFREPARLTGEGTGFWEAPRGALYHSEKVVDGKIEGYQIIIPSTWNLAPINGDGEHGPLEQALIGVPVADIEKPINALRTVHSFDPCTACAVHVTERGTGKHFETVEGFADEKGNLSPIQQSFIDHAALQCGYCTPGFIVSATALLRENPHPTRDEIVHYMSGNLCRCTGYKRIIEAIEDAAERMNGGAK